MLFHNCLSDVGVRGFVTVVPAISISRDELLASLIVLC